MFFPQIVCIASFFLLEASAKNARKTTAIKKATSQKPSKHPKALLDLFKEFPADDREFIKQLDKQFEKFGENIKIKVEKENATTSKNSKRTIDGSLGYVSLQLDIRKEIDTSKLFVTFQIRLLR